MKKKLFALITVCFLFSASNTLSLTTKAYASSGISEGGLIVEAQNAMLTKGCTNIQYTTDGTLAHVAPGTDITVQAYNRIGYKITGWQVEEYGDDYSDITPYSGSSNTFEFTVYDYNCKITPIYVKTASSITFYDCSLISNGYEAYSNGSGFTVNAYAGDIIKVKALGRIGYEVNQWKLEAVVHDSTGDKALSPSNVYTGNDVLEFKVTDCDYEISPVYSKAKYNVFVNSADIIVEGVKMYKIDGVYSNNVEWGTKITITANEIEGKTFTGWIVNGVTLTKEKLTEKCITFAVPLSDVSISATYDNNISVNSAVTENSTVNTGNYRLDINSNLIIIMVLCVMLLVLILSGSPNNKEKVSNKK